MVFDKALTVINPESRKFSIGLLVSFVCACILVSSPTVSMASNYSPVYRLYYEGTKDHHYTMDRNEYDVLAGRGWRQEGIAWYSSALRAGTSIMGSSVADASALFRYFDSKVGEGTYPASVYSNYGAPSLMSFCTQVVEESEAEGVRAEVVFAQAMKETGWLRFGGSVRPEQCNFCGLGATGASAEAASFESVRVGLRAQVQHLKAYASRDALTLPLVDPRFNFVERGCAPMLEDLNGKWAVPGVGYGESIAAMIQDMIG